MALINMTSKDGVTLKTAGTYVEEDITVVPTFESGGGSVDDGYLHADFTANIANGKIALPAEVAAYFVEKMQTELAAVAEITIKNFAWNTYDVTHHQDLKLSIQSVPLYNISISVGDLRGESWTTDEMHSVRAASIEGAFSSDYSEVVLGGQWSWQTSTGRYNWWAQPHDFSANTDDLECSIKYIATSEL